MSKQNAQEPFWNFWAEWEIQRGKMMVLFFSVVGFLVFILVVQQLTIRSQSTEITRLSKDRIMFGFANEDGAFVSVDKRPKKMVMSYAENCLNNLYNRDPDSVVENFNYVLKCYDTRYVATAKKKLDEIANEVVRDGLQHLYYRKRHRLVETKNGYDYISEGMFYEYAGQVPTDKKRLRITMKLAKISPTLIRFAGISLIHTTDEKLQ